MAENLRDALNLPYEFTIGGRTIRARSLNLKEEMLLEDALGKSFDDIGMGGAKARLEVLYLVFKQGNPTITRDEVAELVTGEERDVATRIILSAIAGKKKADELLRENPLSLVGGTETSAKESRSDR